MATEPFDEAYVEIKPDVSHFDRDLQRDLNASFKNVERKVDDLTDEIVNQFDRLIIVLDAHFANLQHVAEKTFDHIQDSARDAGRSIATDIEIGTKIAKHEIDDLADDAHHDFNRIERDARGSGFSIGKMFSSIGSAVGSVISTIGDLGKSLSSVGSSVGSAAGSAGSAIGSIGSGIGSVAQIAAYAILIPVVIGLAGALIQLSAALFALPAAAGVALAIFAPLLIAFKGIGEAVSAGLSGDMQKFNEALKGLAPSAQKVVREFVSLKPILDQIKKSVQGAFFDQLVGAVKPLATSLLPALNTGMTLVATSLGKVVRGFLDLLSSQESVKVISEIFKSAGRIVDRVGPSFVEFFRVMFGIVEKGLPYVEKFFSAFADGIDKITGWLGQIQKNGQLTGWLDQAVVIGKRLWEVLKQLGVFALTVFGSFGDEGSDTLNGMADALKKVNEYLKSKEGQETLHNLGVIIHWAGNALVFLIGATVQAYQKLNLLFNFVRGIGPFFSKLGDWFSKTWHSIVEWTKSAWHSIQDTVISGWNGVINYFKSVWTYFIGLFVNGWNNTVAMVSDFITRVKNTIIAFPGILKQFLIDATHWVAFQIGYIIGSIVKSFFDMGPRVLSALSYLWQGIVNTWNNIVNFFTTTIPALAVNVGMWFADMGQRAYNAVVSFILSILNETAALPGKMWTYVKELYDRVVNTFIDLKNAVVQKVKDLVTAARDEAGKLPTQVHDAANGVIDKMYQLGRDMIIGLGDGMKALAGWVADRAKEIVLDAWNGAKKAIGSNSPSKKWMQTGKDSAHGYALGFDSYDITKHVVSSIKMPLDKFNAGATAQTPSYSPQVSVGGAQIVAYLQIGDDQLHPVMVRALHDNPQDVALAAQQGDTRLARRR